MSKHKPDSGDIHRSLTLLLSIFVLIGLVCSASGASYSTYYASDYSIVNGKPLSKNDLSSAINVDDEYFTVESREAETAVEIYNPSSYASLGATSRVSGSVANLTSRDALSMDFRSYPSSFHTEDYVDNDMSDVDLDPDKGVHSSFSSQQAGPDSIYDTLLEENAGSASNTTLIGTESFEGTWPPTGWIETGDWNNESDQAYDGTISADFDGSFLTSSGDLDTSDLNCSDANAIYVDFWYRDDDLDTDDFLLRYYDGSSWDIISDLGATTQEDQWLHYQEKITDSQYFVSTFKVRWSAVSVWTGESAWIDCVTIQKEAGPVNYEVDLEVQWTSVDFNGFNGLLCIYGGTVSAEDLRVDVWNGTEWQNLIADLTSGWNNASISSYLDSSTFTIRFKGNTEANDTVLDTWNIDTAVLHVWTDQNVAEIEFSGSCDTYDWTQSNWTIVSACTIDSVDVTIQLYDYTLDGYSTSGDGYIAYKSSSQPNTAETTYQSIILNPEDFRNKTGSWKIRIAGAKSTDAEFDLKIDLIEFRPTYNGHMVSTEFFFSSMVSDRPITLNFTTVSQFNVSNVNVTLRVWNYSAFAYQADGEGSQTYTAIGSNETKVLNISTNPQFYTSNGNAKLKITGVSSTSTPFRLELNQVLLLYGLEKQNSFTIPFDWFSTFLYLSPLIFVPAFLIALKLKRKKTIEPYTERLTGTFSEALGMTHKQIVGKKMLLEIDPTSDFHQALSSLVAEAKNNNEELFILTNRNSTLHSTLSDEPNIKFLLLTSKTSSPQQINTKETLLPATDLSVLLNAFVRTQKTESKRVINVIFDNLSDVILRCGFEKTYKFTRFLLEAISSPTTTALFLFNPTAHEPSITSSIRGLFPIHLAFTTRGLSTRT
jgi:hypothetical protein